jgi:hypothetical protein
MGYRTISLSEGVEMTKQKFTSIIKEHKKLFIIIAIGLLLLELEIFVFAAVKSGRESWLQVTDDQGTIIHETDGSDLSDFNKYYFEKTFGPLDQYKVKLITKDVPFPFRAWFVAAVGIPIGIMLLFGFLVRAYMALFYGEVQQETVSGTQMSSEESRLEKVLAKVSRFNIFTIGFLVLVGIFAYWVIPNFITYLGKVGIETLIRFKWFFLAVFVALFGLVVWLLYLRYRLATKTIESQTEIDIHRLQLEMSQNLAVSQQLEYHPEVVKTEPDAPKKKDEPKTPQEKNE